MQSQVSKRLALPETVESNAPETGVAFGEAIGIEVPTQYSAEIHAAVNALMAADSLITPTVLGMSSRTVWFSRMLAGMLLVTRSNAIELDLRQRLELEAITGGLVLLMGLNGTLSRNIFERLYFVIGGTAMIANSLMTRLPE